MNETVGDIRPIEPREYRLSPANLRMAYYVAACGILLGVAIVGLAAVDSEAEGIPAVVVVTPYVFTALSIAVLANHWRLRVDGQGVARRRMVRWVIWPWEAFHSGRLERGILPFQFIDPARPFGSRKLSLTYLSDVDRESAMETIRGYWVRPQIEPPEEITIDRTERKRRSRLTMNRDGIEVWADIDIVGSEPIVFSWDEVVEARFVRMERDQPTWRELRLRFPGFSAELVVLVNGNHEKPLWEGPGPAVIAAFLERYVPSGRLKTAALAERAVTPEDIEAKEARFHERWREFRLIQMIFSALCLAFLAWPVVRIFRLAVSDPEAGLLSHIRHASDPILLAVMFLMTAGSLVLLLPLERRRQRTALAEERARVEASMR